MIDLPVIIVVEVMLLCRGSLIMVFDLFFSVEIVPICKDSVVCLPSKLAHQQGGIGQVCIVHRVTNHIMLIDPVTAQCKFCSVICSC